MDRQRLDEVISLIVSGRWGDPFAILGIHLDKRLRQVVVRTFQPQADAVTVVDSVSGEPLGTLERLHPDGFFAGPVESRSGLSLVYRLRLALADGSYRDVEDPYRFAPILGEMDVYRLAEGRHLRLDEKLGARPLKVDSVSGVGFVVWAPHASRVSVVGDFNDWDERRHPMRFRVECGVWELFLPGIRVGARYLYDLADRNGNPVGRKMDPFARACETTAQTAAVVSDFGRYPWRDLPWMRDRRASAAVTAPISIYQVHLGSWRRPDDGQDGYLSFLELADNLVPYVQSLGFTHIGLLPLCEHGDDSTLGFDPLALFAPSSRFGKPQGIRVLVDRCHQAGIGIIIDWTCSHFPTDPSALHRFDGASLYEEPPLAGTEEEGNNAPAIYQYGRFEVADFLLNSALYWIEEFHVDGFRVDTVGAMLYLDWAHYGAPSRQNSFGGSENLDGIAFLRRLSDLMSQQYPDVIMIADDAADWPMISRPTYVGGLGFRFLWNRAWAADTLSYFACDPVFRKFRHDRMTYGLRTAFTERFVLPLSHDRISEHGPLLSLMPGDRWQRFANLRAYYAFLYAHPGKKLMFMGCEFAQEPGWDFHGGLDWHLTEDNYRRGLSNLVGDLNRLYRSETALSAGDCDPAGFAWIDSTDAEKSVFCFLRRSPVDGTFMVIVCNFTPVVRYRYRVGVPWLGFYEERLNSDSAFYGGSDIGNRGGVPARPVRWHDYDQSLELTLPPLAVLMLALSERENPEQDWG